MAIAAVAALFLFAITPAKAGTVDFEIVEGLSSVSFYEIIDLTVIGAGLVDTGPQFPGSDVTSIFGNILGTWDPGAGAFGTFELISGGQYTLGVGAPGAGGVPGLFAPFDPVTSEPPFPPAGLTPDSNFGLLQASGFPVGLAQVIYGVHGDWATTAPGARAMDAAGDFAFSPGDDFMLQAGGRLAFASGLGNDTTSVAGDPGAVFGTAGVAPMNWDPSDLTAGPLGTLTIPIESSFSIPLGGLPGGATGTVTFINTGVIVATPKVPEPSSLVLLGIGVVGLFTCGWRLRKRRA